MILCLGLLPPLTRLKVSVNIKLKHIFNKAKTLLLGGWDADGKSENIWDRFTHEYPDRILNQDTGDIACDSYHKYPEDVQLLKDLGVTHYRFSLSWARIFPEGNQIKSTLIAKKNYNYIS